MATRGNSNFVVDGCRRGRIAVRADVESKFAERLRKASLWDRIKLRREIEREIARRQVIESPVNALY